jgi:glycosyltransferase involved in cell wall biosynthesis
LAKILFITTTNLSTNPRLLKEVKLARDLNHDPEILAFHQGGWSDKMDLDIVRTNDLKVFYLSALRKPFRLWIYSTFVQEICRRLYVWNNKNRRIAAYAETKRSFLLLQHLHRLTDRYHFVIGHNMGALYPAWWFSSKNGIPFAFDIEDYHPGEGQAELQGREYLRRVFLLRELLPECTYFSYASPLVGREVQKLLNGSAPQHFLINNCFSRDEFNSPKKTEGPLRLVWYSQHISYGRGLEHMIEALRFFGSGEVQLFLIGILNRNFYRDYIETGLDNIHMVDPIPPYRLNSALAGYDVGFAGEPGKDYNNLIVLSNKIWSYFQAGLYILATNTPAQKLFIEEHRDHGILTSPTKDGILQTLKILVNRKTGIRKELIDRYKKAKKYSWEYESERLKQIWKENIQNP